MPKIYHLSTCTTCKKAIAALHNGEGFELQVAFGDGTIVVFDSTRLLQIREGEPVVESRLRDGIIFVQPWTGTGNFIVTTPTTGPGAMARRAPRPARA